jgi:molybdopterin-guanine dinucleotide biosynthesis protein A
MAKSDQAIIYDSGVDDVTVFVLAGGRSSRMGSDKAMLEFGGVTLLERALQTGRAIAEKVYIVGPRERYGQFGAVVEDIHTNCGPLGGIHAALSATTTDLNLMLSVDMPLMTASFLKWLVRQAQAAPELIVVPDALGGLQPLCAIYRGQARAAAEEALKRGDYKISHLFMAVPTRCVTEQQIIAAGFSPDIFRNVNTSEEYAALLAAIS